MRERLTVSLLVLAASTVWGGSTETRQAPLKSGIDRSGFDTSVRPQDDLFRHVNGTWFARTEIPADHTTIGSFVTLRDEADRHLQTLIETAAADTSRAAGSSTQQIGDLYASYMNDAKVERDGAAPVKAELDKIAAMKTPADLARRVGELAAMGIGGMSLSVVPDARQPATTILGMAQGSTTLLPDRDYYLKDDPSLAAARTAYQTYLETIFKLIDRGDAVARAKSVLALETALAAAQWSSTELRDPVKRYNKYAFAQLTRDMPEFDWAEWAKAQHFPAVTEVVVGQPSFFRAYASLTKSTPLDTWKALLTAQLLSRTAPYLSHAFADAHFAFFDKALRGQQTLRARQERAVAFVNTELGDAVGALYVQKHFPPQAKARMEKMVANLLEAYRQSINAVDWMTPETRRQALDKLSTFLPQIGYSEKPRSFAGLVITPDDLAGNALRIAVFNREYNRAKLGKPPDREEWTMTPQTVNAYYSPSQNKIVFPAAILQPPFFTFDAEDAVNYGGIGAVIGHEIGHGFDDQGRQYDGTGALHDWWLPADDREFRKRADMLVEQYNKNLALPGLYVNGRQTLGENIGDLAGLGIAFKAYKLSLGGRPSPEIDGFTGEQRVFLGFAQIWRGKYRDEAMRVRVLSDPHSPPEFRANTPVTNIDAFYDVFNVRPGDKMYRPPDQRVRIW